MIPSDEYAPFYEGYVKSAGTSLPLEGLTRGLETSVAFFESISEDKWEYRYSSGKWTPKEILLHLIDTERVFSYRAMVLVRESNADLPGFDQDEYVKNSEAHKYSSQDLIAEFKAVRTSTIALYRSFSEEALLKKGMANGSEVSVRALGLMIIGHAVHHVNIIEERYL